MKRIGTALVIVGALIAGAKGWAQTPVSPAAQTETGLAAVYSDVLNGRLTASGAVYDNTKLTVANKTLPFGTRVRVTNVANDKSIELVITDRGPVERGESSTSHAPPRARSACPHTVLREVSMEVLELGRGRTRGRGAQ
jgi:rare lipoprotein A